MWQSFKESIEEAVDFLRHPVDYFQKKTVSMITGEVPTSCGPQDKRDMNMGFIGHKNAGNLIKSLEQYNKDVKVKVASGSYAINRGAAKFNRKAVELLEMYSKELLNFKKIDFFASSTLKRLKKSKEKMKEILNKLHTDSGIAKKNYSDDSMRNAALKNKSLQEKVPVRIWHDFIVDMMEDIETTLKELDTIINLDTPEIDFEKLQIKAEKTRILKEGIKVIKRKEIIEKNILEKQQKDVLSAQKKVESYLKEAKSIHDKVKAAYKNVLGFKGKIRSHVSNQVQLEEASKTLSSFFNEYCVKICELVGLNCCQVKSKTAASSPADSEGSTQQSEKTAAHGPADGGIVGLINQIKFIIGTPQGLQGPRGTHEFSKIPDIIRASKEKLEKIKGLEKNAQQQMKKIQDSLKETAKIKAV